MSGVADAMKTCKVADVPDSRKDDVPDSDVPDSRKDTIRPCMTHSQQFSLLCNRHCVSRHRACP